MSTTTVRRGNRGGLLVWGAFVVALGLAAGCNDVTVPDITDETTDSLLDSTNTEAMLIVPAAEGDVRI